MRYLLVALVAFLTLGLTHSSIKRVAVIDTGLSLSDPRFKYHLCPEGHKDFTGEGIEDNLRHGTHVAGLIQQYAEGANYCLIILKYYRETDSGRETGRKLMLAFQEAVNLHVDIVNFSGGGGGFSEQEYLLLRENPDIRFIVAAGNGGLNLNIPKNNYYPASYNLPNVTAVGSIDEHGERSSFSNYGAVVKAWEVGEHVLSTVPGGNARINGTSQSTAVYTGKYIKKW